MAEITAEWSESDLSDLVPQVLLDLVDGVLEPILQVVQTTAAATKAQAQTLKLASSAIPPVTDPVLLAISATLTTVDNFVSDLSEAGGNLLPVAPAGGGLEGFANRIRVGLSNNRLQDRPVLSEDGFVAGFGALAFAPDLITTRAYYNDFTGAIAADDFLKWKLGLDNFEQVVTYQAHHQKYKEAKSASPQPDTPWTTVSLGQFVPGSLKLVSGIQSYLRGINTQVKLDPFDEMIAATDKVLASVVKVSEDIQSTVDFLENSFPELPLKFWKIQPQAGGTESAKESTKVWFDKTANTILSEIPKNSFVTGFFVLFGGPTLSGVQANYDIWDNLILP